MNYERIYNQIVDFYKQHPFLDKYSHTHHIKMRSLGGSDSKDNLVHVPFRVHYILHRCLLRFLPCKQTAMAVRVMTCKNVRKLKHGRSKLFELEMRRTVDLIARGVIQYDLFGNMIGKWYSTAHIMKMTGLSPQSIRHACIHHNVGNGFLWRFVDSHPPEKLTPKSSHRWSNILEYDNFGNFIHKWDNLKEVSAVYHISISHWWKILQHGGMRKVFSLNDHVFIARLSETIERHIDVQSKYNSVPITVFNLDGKLLKHYPTMESAADDLKIELHQIRDCISKPTHNSHIKNFQVRKGILNSDIEICIPLNKSHVACYLPDGTFVKEYHSLHEAECDITCDRHKLLKAIRSHKLYHELQWRYITTNDFKNPIEPVIRRFILATYINTGEQRLFRDSGVAGRELKCDQSCILKCIKRKLKQVKGWIFEYVMK